MTCNFYKLCQKIDFIGKPIKHVSVKECGELLEYFEVYSSFRPCMSATISAEKLEQIVISSDSDSEPVETGCMTSTECQVGGQTGVNIYKQKNTEAYWRI